MATPPFEFHALTDIGRVRAHNEDAIAVHAHAGLMLLADGMGGYNAGEVASTLAIEHIGTQLLPWLTSHKGRQATPEAVGAMLRQSAQQANRAILEAAHKRVVEDLGEAGPAAKTVRKDGAPLKGSKAAPPKTLAKVPASDNTDVNDGRWAALDRLRDADPLAHEEKLMKLSDSERDEYLARA